MLIVHKKPKYEGDMALFTLVDFHYPELIKQFPDDAYMRTKYFKFLTGDIKTDGWDKFKDRPALRNLDKLADLRGSIYTTTCMIRNGMGYEQMIMKAQTAKQTNRCVFLFANNFSEYCESTKLHSDLDVSCLNLIHYNKDNVQIVFRASDMKNEFMTDFVTIYDFFIKPVYNRKVLISFFMSTVQNCISFDENMERLERL